MNTFSATADLEAARGRDQDAFARLVGPFRAGLLAHCYRMLGSSADAEDALQDSLLRAWRGLPGFQGRSSLKSWLYRIATNVCLRAIERRPRRMLPIAQQPAGDPHAPLDAPVAESVWVEPYPDDGVGDGLASPEARYEQRESVELAFVAMLAEDVAFAMPPWPTWFRGREAARTFLPTAPLRPGRRWRMVPLHANGQPALAGYGSAEDRGPLRAHSISVLALDADGLVADYTTFVTDEPFRRFGLPATA